MQSTRAPNGLVASGFLLMGLFCLYGPAFSEPLLADTTKQIFSAHKDKVLQIQVLEQASGSKSTIGSGFLVSPAGYIVTNFHVIADLIHHPQQYRAEYLLNTTRKGKAELVDIDIVHDLALLKGEALHDEFLALEEVAPAQGERLYAFGNPHDLGLTIVEGTYNGLLEKSLYERIHFTGSLNPGMSGGPTVNHLGRVVGVNVASGGNQLGFLVPASYVTQLLARVAEQEEGNVDFDETIRDQLLANQARYIDTLLGQPLRSIDLDGYRVPGRIAPFMNCWGDTRQDTNKALYKQVYHTCYTEDDIFLSKDQSTGILEYRHDLYSTTELGATRFYNLLQERFQDPPLSLEGDQGMVTNYVCQNGFVALDGLQVKAVFCLRAYKKYAGIYDALLTAITLLRADEALHTTLALGGVSFENALHLSKLYLESLVWKK